jgi:hypothetical protein
MFIALSPLDRILYFGSLQRPDIAGTFIFVACPSRSPAKHGRAKLHGHEKHDQGEHRGYQKAGP